MTNRSGIALVLLTSALVAPSVAMARPASHAAPHPNEPSLAEQLRAAQQQIAQLQARLDALAAKVDAQAAMAPAPVQTQLAQAQADAAAASAKADTALVQARAANEAAGVRAANPPLPAALKALANTSISGRMYFNASHVSHTVNGIKTGNQDNGGGFAIKRMFVGVDHKFDDVFSASVVMDADNTVATTAGNIDGRGFFIKKAYLQARIRPELVVRLGSADLPWVPYVEGIYGYRHIEQVMVDRTKFGVGQDWGAHVSGDLAGGVISYQLSAVDGGGFRDPHFSRTIDLEGRLSAKYKGFNVAVGGYTGKLGKNLVAAVGAPLALHTYNRFDALAAYQGKIVGRPVTLGFEYLYAHDKAFNTSAPIAVGTAEDSAEGYAAFASISPVQRWSLFGKYESLKPSETLHPGFKEQYVNLGLQWSPASIVDLALVYKRDQASGGALAVNSIQSGVIGCSVAATIVCTGRGSYDEFGLYGQFRF
jgi:hypothetical protein